jgi:hypothetical protein
VVLLAAAAVEQEVTPLHNFLVAVQWVKLPLKLHQHLDQRTKVHLPQTQTQMPLLQTHSRHYSVVQVQAVPVLVLVQTHSECKECHP